MKRKSLTSPNVIQFWIINFWAPHKTLRRENRCHIWSVGYQNRVRGELISDESFETFHETFANED